MVTGWRSRPSAARRISGLYTFMTKLRAIDPESLDANLWGPGLVLLLNAAAGQF